MSRTTTILIAEDHTLMREGLKALLSTEPNFEIVGEACDGRETVDMVGRLAPDLLLLDLSMPLLHGLEAIKEIKRGGARTKILVLTVHKDEEFILAAFKAGADGYILKEASHAELRMALESVLSGNRFISPAISQLVIDAYVEAAGSLKAESSWDTLTGREREILKLIAEGHTNRRISDMLSISVRTVETHRANLMRKLDVHSVAELTALAADRGLINR
jgi:DNA-binding NarL/FixJ family response regulator